jgi:replicative DNA helicase Mcm
LVFNIYDFFIKIRQLKTIVLYSIYDIIIRMAGKFIDFVKSLIPLSDEKRKLFFKLTDYIGESEIKEIKKLLKQNKVEIITKTMDISPQILDNRDYLFIENKTTNSILSNKLSELNKIMLDKKIEESYIDFSKNAINVIPKFIAMSINDYDYIKYAITLQLFSTYDEPVHILLIGDKGVGKTNILRSVTNVNHNTIFGPGNGSLGLGFCVTVKGNNVENGLIANADKGICAIEKINLIKPRDQELLFSAMESGYFDYEDKKSKSYKFNARVRLLACLEPKDDRFVGWTLETLKKQIPVNDEILSKFHLIFMIRKNKESNDHQISKNIIFAKHEKIMSADEKFICDFIENSAKINVEIPGEFDSKIVELVTKIKIDEKKYLVNVSPHLILGIKRMLKASARMRLSKKVNEDDYLLVKQIVLKGLKLYD